MKGLLIIMVLVLTGCGGGGSSDSPAESPKRTSTFVVGDSTCKEWPEAAGMPSHCVPGISLSEYPLEQTLRANPSETVIIALGFNDFFWGNRDFLDVMNDYHEALVLIESLGSEAVCFTYAEHSQIAKQLNEGIRQVCDTVLESSELTYDDVHLDYDGIRVTADRAKRVGG